MKNRRPIKAIITDAGYASRFLPITKTMPKAMLPLGNKPIMQICVEECAAAGITEVIIVATSEGRAIYDDYFNAGANQIRKQLKSQGKLDRYQKVLEVLDLPKIRVIEQDPSLPYGNGSPIASARHYIGEDEPFVVLYSDDVVFGSSDVAALVEAWEQNPAAHGVSMAQKIAEEEVDKYGIISLKNGDQLDHIVEKPQLGAHPSTLASYGRYLLTPEIFAYLSPEHTGHDGELWTVDAITEIAKRHPVIVKTTAGQWMTTGDPENYYRAVVEYHKA